MALRSMFQLSEVSKRYGALSALEHCNLEVDVGATTVLIGPSGCGKSTILRLMVGLEAPDAGEVRFAGELLDAQRVLAARRRMGYMIQDGGLFPHLTARENVTLMARHLAWEPARVERGVTELARRTHFSADALERFPTQLSGGQRQRVSLMRALMLEPQVLLLDEPLGALDPMIRFELQNDLKEVFAALRKTVVLVTHDLNEAAFFADTIVLLRDGRIVQRGSFEELVRRPASEFVRRFVAAQRRPTDVHGAAEDVS